jgi:hypothetical protein
MTTNDDLVGDGEPLDNTPQVPVPAPATPLPPIQLVAPVPKRPVATIKAELERARGQLRELHPKVEFDRRRCQLQQDRIDKAKLQWKQTHPDEPFEPDLFNPPMRPFPPDERLHDAFHKQHYVVAELESELTEAKKPAAPVPAKA